MTDKSQQTNAYARLLAVAAWIACLPVTAMAQFGPSAVVTDTARIEMLAPSVEVPGTVISRFDSRLASELDARLVWIAEVGTVVEEGDTVARLEDFTFKVREMEAKAMVDGEAATVEFLESEVDRLTRLSERNLSAISQLDQTRSDLAVAKSNLDVARAKLGYAQIALHMTVMRAPFGGIVTERLRSIGERLNAADEVIRLVDPNALEIVARAPLSTVNFIQAGQRLDARNEFRSAESTIRTIVPFGNPQSHMFEVRLNADPELWTVGESVRLSMPTAHAKEVLAVPRDALILRREGTSVFKVGSDSTVSQVNVIVGLGAGALIEVIGDIVAGDTVVVRGAESLSEGMSVEKLN